MARFLLQRCKIRKDRIVPLREEISIELSWPELQERFVPSGSTQAKMNLLALKQRMFVGVVKDRKDLTKRNSFILEDRWRTGKIGWLLKADPLFPSRVLEVFQVVSLEWDAKIEEMSSEYGNTLRKSA